MFDWEDTIQNHVKGGGVSDLYPSKFLMVSLPCPGMLTRGHLQGTQKFNHLGQMETLPAIWIVTRKGTGRRVPRRTAGTLLEAEENGGIPWEQLWRLYSAINYLSVNSGNLHCLFSACLEDKDFVLRVVYLRTG